MSTERFVYKDGGCFGPRILDRNTGRWMGVDLVREMADTIPAAIPAAPSEEEDERVRCETCDGSGRVVETVDVDVPGHNRAGSYQSSVCCPDCGGDGWFSAALAQPTTVQQRKPVAWLVTNLPSGEPSLCFEDERGDYGDEDHRPVFEALVLLSDAQASLQELAADTARLDWLDKNPGRIKHSIGYRDSRDSWVYTDANGYGHDAESLRAAIDSAIALVAKEAK
jgi:hypothetical protein